MSGRRRRWRRVLHQMRPNLVVLVFLALLGAASFWLLRTELLKNAQDLGTSLAQSYASEERNNLTVYETLLTFGTESIDSGSRRATRPRSCRSGSAFILSAWRRCWGKMPWTPTWC